MSDPRLEFGCFDPTADVDIYSADLPHWLQLGAAMFVTYRTIDSMPRQVVQRRREELVDQLQRYGIEERLARRVVEFERVDHSLIHDLPRKNQREFRRKCDRLWHQALDECHGECELSDPSVAGIVSEAILYFDGVKYDVERFVIMPNHVHLIVQFRDDATLNVVGQSWLRYTARRVNKRRGKSGCFWQGEPFDHLIRSEAQFRYLQQYIADNPGKANLSDRETLLWIRPSS